MKKLNKNLSEIMKEIETFELESEENIFSSEIPKTIPTFYPRWEVGKAQKGEYEPKITADGYVIRMAGYQNGRLHSGEYTTIYYGEPEKLIVVDYDILGKIPENAILIDRSYSADSSHDWICWAEKTRSISIERSKRGIPCLWESGGGYTNTGNARIITGKDGQPKKAIYIRRRGELANANHALIPLEAGDYIIEADHHRKDFHISLMRIVDIEEQKEKTLGNSIENLTVAEYEKKYPTFGDLGEAVVTGVNGYPIKKLPNGNYVMAKGRDEIWGYTIYPEIERMEMYAITETIASFSRGEWDIELPTFLEPAVQAAMAKATCYHCRKPHFIVE